MLLGYKYYHIASGEPLEIFKSCRNEREEFLKKIHEYKERLGAVAFSCTENFHYEYVKGFIFDKPVDRKLWKSGGKVPFHGKETITYTPRKGNPHEKEIASLRFSWGRLRKAVGWEGDFYSDDGRIYLFPLQYFDDTAVMRVPFFLNHPKDVFNPKPGLVEITIDVYAAFVQEYQLHMMSQGRKTS